MSRRHNAKGRSKSGAPFIALRHYVYDSAAYRSLSPADRAVYLAVLRRYNGTNNGRIAVSIRDAAEEAAVNKDTVGRSLKRLIDRGFIEIAGDSNLLTRTAREYRLTHERCDRTGALASKAFLRWAPAAEPATAAPVPAPARRAA